MTSVQDILEGEQLLESLWREPGRADLRCLMCQVPFTDDALIRTFRIEPPGSHDAGYSTVVPTHKGDILFFDRHMNCVAEHQVRFSAVSHVWDPNISYVQQQQRTVPQTPVAASNVLDISTKIYSGIEEGELWLDYLSVPQWSDTLKNNIIRIMHKLFTTAEKTIIYFADVDSDVVKQLYKKERSPERLDAVISVCNSTYFKRVWTAMEFIRSGCVGMMTSDCTYLADLDDPAFLTRLYHVWNEEVRHYAQVQHLERKVKMGKEGKNGKNQVPWSLGALGEAKALKRVNFAMGSTLLCKRGCRDQMDYLHALRGIVPVSSATPMTSDFKTEFYQVAWECLKAGDLSPLLMTPFMEMGDPRGPGHWSEFAFIDVFTWSLSEEKHAPALEGEIQFNDIGQLLSLNLQEIGVVSVVRQPRDLTRFDLLLNFSYAAMTALEFDGPDVKDFVAAMERTHGAMPSIIMKNLETRKEVQRLQKALTRNFNKPSLPRWPIQGEDDVRWLADALSLSQVQPGHTQSILAKNNSEFGTMHCAPHDYTVGITCMGCHRIFAHKVASFVLPTELRFARVYRIPRLLYHFSHKNGLALLVQKDRVVGRMVWATPACACKRTETVTLRMPKLFLPKSFYDK